MSQLLDSPSQNNQEEENTPVVAEEMTPKELNFKPENAPMPGGRKKRRKRRKSRKSKKGGKKSRKSRRKSRKSRRKSRKSRTKRRR
jgi:hypothetical protein